MVRSNSSERDGDSEEKIRKSMFGQLKIIVPPFSAREILDEQPRTADLIDDLQEKARWRFSSSPSSSQRHRSASDPRRQKVADHAQNMNDRPVEEEKHAREVVSPRDKNLQSEKKG